MSLQAVDANSTVETIKLTVPECEIYSVVLNIPPQNGCGIKDLRMIESVITYLQSVLPKRPDKPKFDPPKDGSQQYSVEETKENTQKMVEYNRIQQELDKTEIEVQLNSFQKGLLKQKMMMCTSFQADANFRKIILSAAEKVGA